MIFCVLKFYVVLCCILLALVCIVFSFCLSCDDHYGFLKWISSNSICNGFLHFLFVMDVWNGFLQSLHVLDFCNGFLQLLLVMDFWNGFLPILLVMDFWNEFLQLLTCNGLLKCNLKWFVRLLRCYGWNLLGIRRALWLSKRVLCSKCSSCLKYAFSALKTTPSA